jgi:CheY-like chemotaxis protein
VEGRGMGHILIIDDEKPILDSMRLIIADFGNEVKTARTGLEGIKYLHESCDVIMVITDISMPVMDGNAVARHIKNSERSNMPLIAMSASEDEIDQELFDAYLLKPFSREAWLEIIRSFSIENR